VSASARWLAALASVWLAACSGSEPRPSGSANQGNEAAPARNFHGRFYERDFVFTTLEGDSTFLVPWLISTRTRPGGVEREAHGFLARSGTWEEFYSEQWETPQSRAPWRIIPHGSLRIVVGEGDAIDGILFEQGSRNLELEMDNVLQEWTGPRGETFRVQKAAAYLAGRRLDGLVLDVARGHGADEPQPGDWAFLTSGDSLQVVFESPELAPPGRAGAFRGWARLDFRDLQWPSVTMDWTEVRAFQPARRDVPVAWTVSSEGNQVTGRLEVKTAQIRAGSGPGPVLPVDALFEVTGTLDIQGATYPVRGLFRHYRS